MQIAAATARFDLGAIIYQTVFHTTRARDDFLALVRSFLSPPRRRRFYAAGARVNV